MERYEKIEALFKEAFALNSENNAVGACDKWLEAWDLIKELFAEGIAADIGDLSEKHNWKEFPNNHLQYLEMELHNAGIDDNTYHQKRIDYCKELLQWSGSDELLANNTRIALGEAHFDMGDAKGGEQVFQEWIREDPDCGWAYSGWADCLLLQDDGQYEKAEEVLLAGYTRSGLRDGEYVLQGMINLYDEMGEKDKAEQFQKKLKKKLKKKYDGPKPAKPEQARVVKVGRNEPCPCGSGKKYKKCCLQ